MALHQTFFLIPFLLTCGLLVKAQSITVQRPPAFGVPVIEQQDKCGIPALESRAWWAFKGTVVKVVDGDSIMVLTPEKELKHVDLAAIDAHPAEDAARRLLTELILEREVIVLVNPHWFNLQRFVGVVHLQGSEINAVNGPPLTWSGDYEPRLGKDINREMIKAGVAQYKEPEAESLSSYTACLYQITEREVSQAKRGRRRGPAPR